MEEEKTYCSDQEALCIETLHWNKRFEKQNASDIYFNVIDDLTIAQLTVWSTRELEFNTMWITKYILGIPTVRNILKSFI